MAQSGDSSEVAFAIDIARSDVYNGLDIMLKGGVCAARRFGRCSSV